MILPPEGHLYKLADQLGTLGLSCTGEGLELAGIPLLERDAGRFVPRLPAQIAKLLHTAYDAGPEKAARVMGGLQAVANALNQQALPQAMVAAVFLKLPDVPWPNAIRMALVNDLLAKNFTGDPSSDDHWEYEDRNAQGRWTYNGGNHGLHQAGLTQLASAGDGASESGPLGPPNPLGFPTDPFTGQPSPFFPPVPVGVVSGPAGVAAAIGAGMGVAGIGAAAAVGGLVEGAAAATVAEGVEIGTILPDGTVVGADSVGADVNLKALGKKFNISADSEVGANVLRNLNMPVQEFISRYRRGSIKARFPSEYLKNGVTIGQALKEGGSTVRKLLTNSEYAK